MAVATAIAVGGMAITAASAVNSFIQSSKQDRLRRQAEADSAKAMEEARKKLGVNYTKGRAIQKEPYELQRESMLSQGNLLTQAGVESERGAPVVAGKVMMAQNDVQAGIRTEMGKELTEIEKENIAEESRLRDLGVQLDLGEAEGAALAARDAEEASTAAMSQGFESVTSLAQQGLAQVPLFEKSGASKAFGKIEQGAKSAGLSQQAFQDRVAGLSTQSGYGNLAGVGAMKGDAFTDYMMSLPKSQLKSMYELLYPKT